MLSIQDHQKQYSHIFANMRKNYFFFLAILAICVKTTFFVANQQIRGGERIKGIFCIRRKPTNICHSGSLLLTLTHSISGSLCHCHSRSIRLTLALSGTYWLTRSLLGSLAVYPTLPFGWISSSQCLMSVWLCKRVNALLKGEDLCFLLEFSCYFHAFKILIFLNWEWWTLKAFQRICQYSRAS